MNPKEDIVKWVVAIAVVMVLYAFGLALLFLSKSFPATN